MAKQVGPLGMNPSLFSPHKPGVMGTGSAPALHSGNAPTPTGYGPSLPPIFHDLHDQFTQPPRKPKPDRVVVKQVGQDRVRRTRVTLSAVAHASPRWRGASSTDKADRLNLELSQRREQVVRTRIEALLRQALSDQQFVFDYVKDNTLDPLDQRASIDVDSKAVGSQQTLQEAGKAGRKANDADMRRVDVALTLTQATDTDVVTTVDSKQHVSNATRNWSIKIGMEIKAEAGAAGAGVFNFILQNQRSGQEVEGWAHFSSGGVGASLPIPTIDFGWNDFTTKEECTFTDFDYHRFSVTTSGFNALLFGYEWSTLRIFGLPGGSVAIDVGGFTMGGAGADLGELKYGAMYLRDAPNTYVARVVHDEHKYGSSRLTDARRHRVLFDTEKAIITSTEDFALKDFIDAAAREYQRPGAYKAP